MCVKTGEDATAKAVVEREWGVSEGWRGRLTLPIEFPVRYRPFRRGIVIRRRIPSRQLTEHRNSPITIHHRTLTSLSSSSLGTKMRSRARLLVPFSNHRWATRHLFHRSDGLLSWPSSVVLRLQTDAGQHSSTPFASSRAHSHRRCKYTTSPMRGRIIQRRDALTSPHQPTDATIGWDGQ